MIDDAGVSEEFARLVDRYLRHVVPEWISLGSNRLQNGKPLYEEMVLEDNASQDQPKQGQQNEPSVRKERERPMPADENTPPHRTTTVALGWPLVANKTQHRPELPELAHHPIHCSRGRAFASNPEIKREEAPEHDSDSCYTDLVRDRQGRYCQGFDPDWFLPEELVPRWQSNTYPLYPSEESLKQWIDLCRQIAKLYRRGSGGNPEMAAQIKARMENDLELILLFRPDLKELIDRLEAPSWAPRKGQTGKAEGTGRLQGTSTKMEPTTGNVLQLVGEVWHVRFEEDGKPGSFKDQKGSVFRHLARLLAEPNRRFHAMDFFPPPPGVAQLPHQGRDDSSDDMAMKQYERKLKELLQELKDAEDAHDIETIDKLRKEYLDLAEHVQKEKSARKRRHKKKVGTLPPDGKADQNLRVKLSLLQKRLLKTGLPKLATHLEKHIDNSELEWWYAPPPGTSPWSVSCPNPCPEK